MDLEYLKAGAAKFAYELRKNYPSDESPITYYVCEKEVVVISTKKLYIFFVDAFIDYKNELLSNIEITNIDLEHKTCTVELEKRVFNLVFEEEIELKMLIMYQKKYK